MLRLILAIHASSKGYLWNKMSIWQKANSRAHYVRFGPMQIKQC